MENGLFSIITPTFNPGPKLAGTIDSVLSQKPDLFEYIIVDGGSTDETLDVIRSYGERIKWISEEDAGVYDAMNKGIGMATGNYLYFLGAGDHLRENVLEKVEVAIPNKPLIFVYGNVYLLATQEEYLGEVDEEIIRTDNICHQAIFYERSIFDVMGLYDLKYRLLADWAYNIRCFGDDRIQKVYLPEVIADYEGGGISMTGDANFRKDFPTRHDMETLSAAVAERDEALKDLSAQLAAKDGALGTLSLELAEKDRALKLLSAELTEKSRALELFSAELAEINKEVQSEAARQEERVAEISVRLQQSEGQLKKITNTLGWQLLTYYGPIKYKFLLPVYRLFGRDATETTETGSLRDNPNNGKAV